MHFTKIFTRENKYVYGIVRFAFTVPSLYIGFISGEHDPATDAIASIRLFNKYDGKPRLLEEAKQKLMSRRPATSWAKRNDYKWEGVCMAAYMPKKCICSAPTLKN